MALKLPVMITNALMKDVFTFFKSSKSVLNTLVDINVNWSSLVTRLIAMSPLKTLHSNLTQSLSPSSLVNQPNSKSWSRTMPPLEFLLMLIPKNLAGIVWTRPY